MIERVVMRAFGPHADREVRLGPDRTLLVGPSESGKTAVLEAISFVISGKTSRGKISPDWIRDGCNKAEVEIQLSSGQTFLRSIDRAKGMTRLVDGRSVRNESSFTRALGALADTQLATFVMAPMGWISLAATNARPLRDLLLRVLPDSDPANEVITRMQEEGWTVSPEEAAESESKISRLRLVARKARDRADGRFEAFEQQAHLVESQLPVGHSKADLAAWEAHDKAVASRKQAEALRARAESELTSWRARAAELADEPAAVDSVQAKQAVARAEAKLETERERWRVLKSKLDAAQREVSAFTEPDVCPTCKRKGWTDGEDAFRHATNVAKELASELAALGDEGKKAREAHDHAAKEQERATARAAWLAAKKALGPEPELMPLPPEPEEPKSKRPSGGSRTQEDLDQALAALEDAKEARKRAQNEADRLDALLRAVREAPTIVAQRQREAFGDLGPVTFHFAEDPAVEVRIDGRLWWLASRGRLVVADAWIRAAVRRAWGIDLPLFIDNTQDVAGQRLPEIPGPVVHMRTAEGAALEIREG